MGRGQQKGGDREGDKRGREKTMDSQTARPNGLKFVGHM